MKFYRIENSLNITNKSLQERKYNGKLYHIVIDARHVNRVVDGLGRYVLELINSFHIQEGQKITILHVPEFPKTYLKNYASLNFLEVCIKGSNPKQQFVLPFIIKKLKADCYFYPFIDPPIFSPAKKNFFAVHDLNHFFYSKYAATERKTAIFLARTLIKIAARLYNGIIVFSEFIKNQLEENVNSATNKTHVIYHGFTPLSFESEKEGEDNNSKFKPYLLYVGNNRPHKNLKRLLEAFQLLLEEKPELNFIIAGNMIKRFLNVEDSKDQLKISSHVHVLNKISNTKLKNLYKEAELVVYPSLSEGFGLPLLEAWNFEVPIITSNTTCLPEIAGDAAAFFDPSDPMKMAREISLLISNEESKTILIEKGKLRLKQFSWKKSAEKHLEIFASL